MTLIDDLRTAIDDYPKDDVEISITDFRLRSGHGRRINPNEECLFRVKVWNKGHLDMTNLHIDVEGKEGCLVSQTDFLGKPMNFSTSIDLPVINLNAHQSWYSRWLYLQAGKVTDGSVVLLEAHLGGWDASLHHLLIDHSLYSDDLKATVSDVIEERRD